MTKFNTVVLQCVTLTLKSSVSMRLLGTFTELTCRAGPLSLTLLSPELGVTHSITGWVVPSSWLSTWLPQHDMTDQKISYVMVICIDSRRNVYMSIDHSVCSIEAAGSNQHKKLLSTMMLYRYNLNLNWNTNCSHGCGDLT